MNYYTVAGMKDNDTITLVYNNLSGSCTSSGTKSAAGSYSITTCGFDVNNSLNNSGDADDANDYVDRIASDVNSYNWTNSPAYTYEIAKRYLNISHTNIGEMIFDASLDVCVENGTTSSSTCSASAYQLNKITAALSVFDVSTNDNRNIYGLEVAPGDVITLE